jgi:putative MFS transporter
LGQFIGAIGFGHLAERIGRISTIMITTAIFALGGLASAFATGFASMIVLRMLQGLGLGAEVPVAAAYINEIAPANKRGSFVLLYEFIFAVGIVVAGFVGRWAIPNWGWQSLFLIGSIPPLIALFFMRMLPESPRWLARRQSRSWHRVERDRARGPNCSALSIATAPCSSGRSGSPWASSAGR